MKCDMYRQMLHSILHVISHILCSKWGFIAWSIYNGNEMKKKNAWEIEFTFPVYNYHQI